MFEVSNLLNEYLGKNDRNGIIGALMGYVSADRYFRTNDFDEALKYVLSKEEISSKLFVPFDDSILLEEDESKWDEDYYVEARLNLKENFCEKRIEHIKTVARKLAPAAPVKKEVVAKPVQKTSKVSQSVPTSNSFPALEKSSRGSAGGKTGKKPWLPLIVGGIILLVLLILLLK